MSERPILFSAPMVRAIMAGQKTQTRRIVKREQEGLDFLGGNDGDGDEPGISIRWGEMQYDDNDDSGKPQWLACCTDYPEEGFIEIGNPYGQVGDCLWVRETWYCDDYRVQRGPYLLPDGERVADWREGGTLVYGADGLKPYEAEQPVWKPSIHMPRWASRIDLEITGVRVERLQAISEADAVAEGCALECMTPTGDDSGSAIWGPGGFCALWSSINGAESWDANPWVWVIEFKRVTP